MENIIAKVASGTSLRHVGKSFILQKNTTKQTKTHNH